MRSKPILRTALAGALWASTAAHPQQPSPIPPPPVDVKPLLRRPETKAAPNVIRLDARVTGSSGKPLVDLRPQDFNLLVDGVSQPIAAWKQVAAEPNLNPTEIILVVDTINVPFDTVAFIRNQLGVYFQRHGEKLPQPMAIIAVTDTGTKIEMEPTTDAKALKAYLDQTGIGLRTIRRSSEQQDVERLNVSLRALNVIATYEAKRPGSKSLLWIGPGWPLLQSISHYNKSEGRPLYRFRATLLALLEEARITLYSVDPTGAGSDAYFRTAYKDFLKPVARPEDAIPATVSLGVIATETGGRVVLPSNDLANEIDQCVQDAAAYYTITFEEPPTGTPAVYHSVTLKVDRAATVRTRSGFYAFP